MLLVSAGQNRAGRDFYTKKSLPLGVFTAGYCSKKHKKEIRLPQICGGFPIFFSRFLCYTVIYD